MLTGDSSDSRAVTLNKQRNNKKDKKQKQEETKQDIMQL